MELKKTSQYSSVDSSRKSSIFPAPALKFHTPTGTLDAAPAQVILSETLGASGQQHIRNPTKVTSSQHLTPLNVDTDLDQCFQLTKTINKLLKGLLKQLVPFTTLSPSTPAVGSFNKINVRSITGWDLNLTNLAAKQDAPRGIPSAALEPYENGATLNIHQHQCMSPTTVQSQNGHSNTPNPAEEEQQHFRKLMVDSNLKEAVPLLTQEVFQSLGKSCIITGSAMEEQISEQIIETAVEQHTPPASPPSIYTKSNLRFSNRLSSVSRPLLSRSKLGMHETMDLFFAEMFWYYIKKSHNEYPSWHMIESLRKDYLSFWSEELSENLSLHAEKLKTIISNRLFLLNSSIDETKNPNRIGEIFADHVREIAELILCGERKDEKFLIFCAFVREMFMSCMDNNDLPINWIILSISNTVIAHS